MALKRKVWERVPPSEPCAVPNGHGHVDVLRADQRIPSASYCPHCMGNWQIVMHTPVVYWLPAEGGGEAPLATRS